MKKQTSTARPTGLIRVRSLLVFRHGNPIGRLVSTVVAVAIAALLMFSTGTAYADDTAPTPGDAAATADATPDPATDPATDATTDAPADPPASDASTPSADDTSTPGDTPSDAATSDAPDSSSTDKPAGPVMSALTTLAKADVTPNLVGNAACQDSPPQPLTMVGGFEIDGDPCADEGGIDFDTPVGDTTDDGYGDNNWFTGGSSENDDPADWTLTGGANTGKADIGTAWAWSHTFDSPGDPGDGHVFAYFGFTNDSTAGGTQDYSLEYNQADPVNGRPVRTPGDLLFHFFANGSAPLEFKAAYIYTDMSDSTWGAGCVESGTLGAGWCPFSPPDPLTLADVFTSATSPTGEYAEGAIDITALFGEGNCSGTFGTTFLRSAPGAFFTSELKDYVSPLGVTTPSTCGSLDITKTDADTGVSVGGGIYQIVGDPRPGANSNDTLCIYDGTDAALTTLLANDQDVADLVAADCDDIIADGAADGSITVDPVEPGTYTVTEIVPPPGYMLNPEAVPPVPCSTQVLTGPNCMTVTVGESESQSVAFANHRIWEGLTATKTANPAFNASYLWSLDKYISANGVDGWTKDTTTGSPLMKNAGSGDPDAGKLFYQLVLTEGAESASGYTLSGNITVSNPADNVGEMTATVTEDLPAADSCKVGAPGDAPTLDSVDVTVGTGDSVAVPYVCTFSGTPTTGTNTAHVKWNRNAYPQDPSDLAAPSDAVRETANPVTKPYDFADAVVTTTNKTVTLSDTKIDLSTVNVQGSADTMDGPFTWTAQGTEITSEVYSVTVPDAAPGACSARFDNTATATGDGVSNVNDDDQVVATDDAHGVICQGADLTALIDDSESLTRTFPWAVEKATTTPSVTVTNGAASATYDVTVTTGDGVDSNWHIGGSVTVSNPNLWEDVPLTGLDVSYSGSNDADTTDDCAVTETLVDAVPAGGSRTFHYNCTFEVQPAYDGSVHAAITWDAAAASTPHGSPVAPTTGTVSEADWDVTPVDATVTVHDDRATGQDVIIGTLDWADVFAMTDHKTVIHYTVPLTGLPGAGSCASKVNTVWVIGHDGIHLDADDNSANNSATVRVCTPAVAPPAPPVVKPPPATLPNTGGPDVWPFAAGLALVLAGGLLVAGGSRRRRRS